ncbi:hypothetical protein PP175_25405 (plasmid) [Aneurinibacillus sp. Ricciae_BoGa-3]|uniref:hypothetical protein n=1 Tax=Aneurinibacillus sp. Ricciae_BoGa-3 TaxID=3022697 RepID=UPI0023412457|nr:hypothetical protein [Aneurinibacillus sp. Ricciae_BoGa-3]WCK57407.1 hypothetical protein PP175_25405 [Aneurinibacillus sp. Ricciae_BoGa-3]
MSDSENPKQTRKIVLDEPPFPQTKIDWENGPSMKLLKKLKAEIQKLKDSMS